MPPNSTKESRVQVDFVEPAAADFAPAALNIRKRRCHSCGASASRRAGYCSGCGRALNRLMDRITLQQTIIGAAVAVACVGIVLVVAFLISGP